MIALPAQAADEEAKARLVVAEMERLGYTSTRIDGLGSAVGTMGTGETLIAFDGHIDTVGVGNPANWTFDPFEGFEDDVLVGGRGASDQLGGVVSAVYGGRIAKDIGLLSDAYTYMVTGTVQEEDCDGLCWLYLIEEEGVRPAFVVSTEADGRRYLPRPPWPDGDPGRRRRRLVPRLGTRARRQRDLQDGRDPPRGP